jgi:hypothetical protein
MTYAAIRARRGGASPAGVHASPTCDRARVAQSIDVARPAWCQPSSTRRFETAVRRSPDGALASLGNPHARPA